METRRLLTTGAALACIVVVGLTSAVATAGTERVDSLGDVGLESSIALDSAGNPVIAYRDFGNQDLKVVHCDDPACAGYEDSQSVDRAGSVGAQSSIALDSAGNPVISYSDGTNRKVKVAHCNDPECAGSDESIQSPATAAGFLGRTSLALDAAGNPVVSYLDIGESRIKLLHCNDPACAGNNESIQSPDPSFAGGTGASLVLDAAGNPVISYAGIDDLRLAHCNDPACTGGDESIQAPDANGTFGATSLSLDAAGNPVVSYYDGDNGDLKVMHCNDSACAGGGETVQSPDTNGNVGAFSSLELDGAGHPVVSYSERFNGDLKLIHCNDPACLGGDDPIELLDTALGGGFGGSGSLALDAAGNPVVSYYDDKNNDLKLVHCSSADCHENMEPIASPDTPGTVGLHTSLELDADGNPVISYFASITGDLKLLHCDDPFCVGTESPRSLRVDGDVGRYTSLALDSVGNPVISYYDATHSTLEVMHCNDADCAGGDESVGRPDEAVLVGRFTSLALDAAGNPVVSYLDDAPVDLKVAHCNDPACVGGDESIQSPDTDGFVGTHTSLALDGAGNPVISYRDATNGDLKVAYCNDPSCAGGNESIQSPDTAGDVGYATSLVLGSGGRPAISYQDRTNGVLKLMRCTDPACAGGDESIQRVDKVDIVAHATEFTSLELDSAGNPVIGYYSAGDGDLRVVHCDDPACAGGDERIQSPDTAGDVGRYTSLELDGDGNPVVSYIDSTNGDLRLLHCNDPACAGATPPPPRPRTDAPAPVFSPRTEVDGTPVGPVTVGDINADGTLDLAAPADPSSSVSVYLGNGDGSFQSMRRYAAEVPGSAVAIGDLNGDPFPDLAVTNPFDDVVRILPGPLPEPSPPDIPEDVPGATAYPTGDRPGALAIGDLDHVGPLDLVVANAASDTVSILRADGSGGFLPRVDYAAPTIGVSTELALADMDGSGDLDIVVADYESNQVSLLLGDPGGTFRPASAFGADVLFQPLAVAVGDLNGDLDLDLLVGQQDNGVEVFLGGGDGSFSAQPNTVLPDAVLLTDVRSVTIVDLNLDDHPDALLGIQATLGTSDHDRVGVLLGRGDGSFSKLAEYPTVTGPFPAFGDFDGDGRTDLAVSASGVETWLNAIGPLTPAGASVLVVPVDSGTGTTPVTITFENVTSPGETTLTRPVGGPDLPGGFELASAYFELTTTAQFDRAEVCFEYGGPRPVQVIHWVADSPTFPPITRETSVEVCVEVTSFSPFAVVAPESPGGDSEPPLIACDSADDAWHGANVSLDCTAEDEGSGLADPADAAFSLSTSVPDGAETSNAATGSRDVCDAAGNCATAGPIGGNKVDRKAPTLSLPAAQTVNATSPSGATVSFTASTSDGADPNPTLSCTPPSGSVFAIGASTVSCTATDHVGNTRSGTFNVTVLGSREQLLRLLHDVVAASQLPPAVRTQLLARLEPIVLNFDPRNPFQRRAACVGLTVFATTVRALSGHGIPPALAAAWIADANRIRAVIGC
jgi:hypothetical protein